MVSEVHIRKKFLDDDECINVILNHRKNLKHETINNYHTEKSKYGIPRIALWCNDDFFQKKFKLQPLNCQLAEYTIGQYIDWHEDYLAEIEPNLHRVKTFIIPLNDDFEGAEFEVENYGICNIQKGDCLEFDSRLYHRFSPITDGIRYSLAVWLLGKSWSG